MNRKDTKTNAVEKSRIRDEIEAQVQEFLQKGGKIVVLAAGQAQQHSAIGSVWHSQDELGSLGQ